MVATWIRSQLLLYNNPEVSTPAACLQVVTEGQQLFNDAREVLASFYLFEDDRNCHMRSYVGCMVICCLGIV